MLLESELKNSGEKKIVLTISLLTRFTDQRNTHLYDVLKNHPTLIQK